MKRKELQVGVQYAVTNRRDGINAKYADRVTVLAIEPYEERRFTAERFMKVSNSTKVLVSETVRTYEGDIVEREKLVELRQIVATWEQYEKRQQDIEAREAQWQEIQRTRREYEQNIVVPKLEKFRKLIKDATGTYIYDYTAVRHIDEQAIDHLIKALEAYEMIDPDTGYQL